MPALDADRRSVGAYEVVGEIATGGMAEILLARKSGPAGFERAVAIKRILPQFAKEQSFVDMFVDEARIAARINHANVVHYEELGQDEGQLYLVMEYLEGETALSLLRRARARGHTLSFEECMYIVAEAAEGLHAAHEMLDLDGSELGIVHRDISPQNLFISYRADVKVMDFGIAKAADRITVTESGSLKGKYAYMSPEQAGGEALDHRSDIFSLGIVLYELITGRRLFRRATPVATLRAVREGKVVPPSSYAKNIPPELERICLRCLAREREDRYASAEDLRRELLVAIRAQGSALPKDTLRATMGALFSDREKEKRELLRRVSRGSKVTRMPQAEVDSAVMLPVIDTSSLGHADAPAAGPAPRRNVAIGLVALAALGLAAFGGVRFLRASSLPIAKAERAPTEPAEAPAPRTITVVSVPSGARLFIGDEERGETPIGVQLASGESLRGRLEKAGFAAMPLVLRGDGPPIRELRLREEAARPQPRRRRRRTMERAPASAPAADMAFPRF